MSRRPIRIFAASGSDVDLSNLSLNVLDMGMSGGTVTDPDGIMSSATTASSVTTFEYNAISSGSTDYSFTSGSNLRPYRKHWALTDDDGVAVVGGDRVVIALQIDNTSDFSGDGPTQMFLGIGATPASTTTSTAALCGLCEEHLAGGTTPRYVAMAGTGGGSTLQNANNKRAYCTLMLVGNKMTDSSVIAQGDGADQSYGPSERNYGTTFADDAPLYLVAGSGTRASGVIAANDIAKAVLRYRVIRIGS